MLVFCLLRELLLFDLSICEIRNRRNDFGSPVIAKTNDFGRNEDGARPSYETLRLGTGRRIWKPITGKEKIEYPTQGKCQGHQNDTMRTG